MFFFFFFFLGGVKLTLSNHRDQKSVTESDTVDEMIVSVLPL